jgi:hypothetical protein
VAKVQDGRQAQGQSRQKRSTPGKLENRNKSRDMKRGENAGRLDETKLTGIRQTGNTCINTQGIMGKMGWNRSDWWNRSGCDNMGASDGVYRMEISVSLCVYPCAGIFV